MKLKDLSVVYDIFEARGLPSDSGTFLSLLSEMIEMYGNGGNNTELGPYRAAIVQAFNNGSAADGKEFEKQVNFRVGSIRAAWMGKNWPQIKSCLLRLSKNPKYQRSIKMLDELGNWTVMLVRDPDKPTLGQYFKSIMSLSPFILKDIGRFDPEEHIRKRALHLANEIPKRLDQYDKFVQHWIIRYENESYHPVNTSSTSDDKKEKKNTGEQNATGQNIIDQVLNAIPKNLAKQIRPEIQRLGSQNDKIMYIMRELQKAGIDPNKVLKESWAQAVKK